MADANGLSNFGMALMILKNGGRVQREGWNGKGMHLFYVENWSFISGDENEDREKLPFIAMKTAGGEVVPWLASQTDLLATDWRAA